MSRKGEQFAGLTVALVTPFKDGKVDEAGLKKIVDFHIEAGTDVVSPVGTTAKARRSPMMNMSGSSRSSANMLPAGSR